MPGTLAGVCAGSYNQRQSSDRHETSDCSSSDGGARFSGSAGSGNKRDAAYRPRQQCGRRVYEDSWTTLWQACELARRPCSTELPAVDWRRYHLNVLFVDRSDTVRARVAAGFFERIAEWNGYGRVLLTATAGVDAQPDRPPDMSTNMALFTQAGMLGIRPKLFANLPEPFEADDFYRYDTIVAVDEEVRQRVVAMGAAENPADPVWYTDKVCALGAFSYYCGDELTARGGSALLEKELVRVLLPVLPQARAASDIARPDLAGGAEQWNMFVAAVLVSSAGLFAYLADEYPPDLPEYDPV